MAAGGTYERIALPVPIRASRESVGMARVLRGYGWLKED